MMMTTPTPSNNASPAKKEKRRLDVALLELGLAPTRSQATSLVMMGQVWINGQRHTKAGTSVTIGRDDIFIGKTFIPPEARSESASTVGLRYVSRGGFKLEQALQAFNLDVTDLHCVDAGASTGGFTDCLLQHGAGHVYAVDVGYGQLAWPLRNHVHVTVMERTNARTLEASQFATPIHACVTDVSFISLKKILPALVGCLAPTIAPPETMPASTVMPATVIPWVMALIKPQFECLDYLTPAEASAFDGVVRDAQQRQRVLEGVLRDLHTLLPTWHCPKVVESGVQGPAGNIEYLSLWMPRCDSGQFLKTGDPKSQSSRRRCTVAGKSAAKRIC
ncbi:MAG: TlyA family RNA methyltransferase [Vampirovibrionales bacterium]